MALFDRQKTLISAAAQPAEEVRRQLPWMRWLGVGAIAGAGLGSLLAGATSGLASYFARQVLTPVREHDQNLEIYAVVGSSQHQEIILPATP
ncbi:MAG TPA: lipase, partial [Arthrobacter sp.]|nr:lipase [Arthrobacter sp.]